MQIAEYAVGRRKIVAHVGSAHTEAELGILLQRARDLLEDTEQTTLDLEVEPVSSAVALVGQDQP
ncbi:IS1634 family transposase, partial [Nocardia sp. NPDC058658]